MKILNIRSLITMLTVALSMTCIAAEEKCVLTKVGATSVKTDLGKKRALALKEEFKKNEVEMDDFKFDIPSQVELLIFSVKCPSGAYDSKQILQGVMDQGYRPATAAEILSLDKVDDQAMANIPIIALGTVITASSGGVMGICATYPKSAEKGEMTVGFLADINTTISAGKFLLALVKKVD